MAMPKTIDAIFAWVATEPDGQEGICGAEIVMDGRRMFMPLVGADLERVASVKGHAEAVRAASGAPIALVRFSVREELERLP